MVASMSTFTLGAIPLYQQINIALVVISFICLMVACLGGARKRQMLNPSPAIVDGGEAKPCFPLPIDYIWTALLIGLITMVNVAAAIAPATALPEESSTASSWLDPAILLAIHVPIIIRLIKTATCKEKMIFNPLQWLAYIFTAFVLTYACNIIMQLSPVLEWFTKTCGSPEIQEALSVFQDHSWVALLPHIITACVVAPIVEECLFRGMLYPCIKKFLSPRFAAIMTGIVFGAIHMALPQMLALSFLGAFLCLVYERSKTIWLPIIIHASFNSFNVLIAIYYKDLEAYLKTLEQAAQNS